MPVCPRREEPYWCTPGVTPLHPNKAAPSRWESGLSGSEEPLPPDQPSPCRVHTDVQQVLGHLTHPRFTFTQSEADADILYNFSHFKDYR